MVEQEYHRKKYLMFKKKYLNLKAKIFDVVMCRYPELLGREATLHLLPSCVLCLAPPPAPPPAPPQLNPTPDTLGESRGLASGCGTVEGEWHLTVTS